MFFLDRPGIASKSLSGRGRSEYLSFLLGEEFCDVGENIGFYISEVGSSKFSPNFSSPPSKGSVFSFTESVSLSSGIDVSVEEEVS